MKIDTSIKFLCLLTIIITQVSVAKLHADEPKEYTKVLFWVEDALGNKDSCLFIGTPTATDGIDEHLGEVNLYGVPPTKELDIRIVQRTDVNYTEDGIDYWLYGTPFFFGGDHNVRSSEQNIDLKIDYRWQNWDTTKESSWGPDPNSPTTGELFQICGVILEITATHYPVKIYLKDSVYGEHWYSWFCYSIHNESGQCIDVCEKIFEDIVDPFYCINSAEENFWVAVSMTPIVGIKDTTSKMSVTPNPASDYILIEGLKDLELRVFDVIGNFICSFTTTNETYMLNISNLVDGTYFLTDKKNQLLGKFIKGGR